MNLIQQLQATPKWKEFSKWFVQQDYPCTTLKDDHVTGCHEWFVQLHPGFQKGVFEKFIESQGFIIEQWYKTSVKQMYVCLFNDAQKESIFEGTFEELLIWYFNN